MTKIHHLNFGTMRAIPVDSNSITACHCLLLEDANGLVLVDTGVGLIEMQEPNKRYGDQLLNIWGFTIDENLTAIRQLKRMGFDPKDVKHIVISHLDVDHAGGLRDFPNASVHVASEELANLKAKNPRYLFNQFDHGPKWQAHEKSDEKWFGLEARDLRIGLTSAVKLIPLFGHSRGHCGIAVQQGEKWVLHAADTYYRRAEFISDNNPVSALSSHTADDNAQRIASIAALRKLDAEFGGKISFFSTHDVLELPATIFKKLLVVTTSTERFVSNGHDVPTGVWLEEFTLPYMELFNAGIAMTVASPKGGVMPVDPRSAATPEQEQSWQPAIVAAKNCRRLAEMSATDFDGIFLPGGHGPLFDLPENIDLIRLVGEFDRDGKTISAVCHGPAGLLNVIRAEGQPLVAGRRVTCYTAAEEVAAKLDKAVPFMLETELRGRGARFVDGGLKANHVEIDGNLITGQNPWSSASIAKEIAATLRGRVIATTHQIGADTQAYFKIGSGPAVVIVHGVGGHKEDWRAVAEALAGKHTVYSVDMLGFGGSSRTCKDLRISTQAAAIKALLVQEGVKSAKLIGNSVGGWAAASFAASYPEMTEKLVVIDPAGFEAMFQGDPPVNLFPDNEEQMRKLLSFVIHSDFAHTNQFATQAFQGFTASGEKAIVPVLWPGLLESARLEVLLPKIKAPTFVIWGKEDKLFPVALCPYLTSLAPGAKRIVIENAGHFVHLDQPAVLIQELKNFL